MIKPLALSLMGATALLFAMNSFAGTTRIDAGGGGGRFGAAFRFLDDYSLGWDDHSDNDDGYPDIAQLVQTVNTTPDADFASVISSVVDADSYLDYDASLALIGDWDTIAHNDYVYKSPDSPVWEVIPKDFDQAFSETSLSLLQS